MRLRSGRQSGRVGGRPHSGRVLTHDLFPFVESSATRSPVTSHSACFEFAPEPHLVAAAPLSSATRPSRPRAMLSFFWLCVLCFVLSVYLLKPLRRILLYLLGVTLGHAYLLFRHLTHNTAERQRKREYLLQNPKWKEHVQATEAGKHGHKSAAATNTLGGSPLASPTSTLGRKPSFAATGSARNLHAGTTPTASTTPPAATNSPWSRKGSTTRTAGTLRSPPAAAATAAPTFTFDGKQFR